MSVFKYEKDADGIVTLTMNMSGPVNALNSEYLEAMDEALEALDREEGLTGVVLASAKNVFFAGGDLKEILAVQPGGEAEFMVRVEYIKGQLRRLEKLPVPVVAAINGAALGGGYEICLACNYRIALNDKSVQLGLPEVSLGLLPGAGGIVRLVNLLGLEAALPYLTEGKKVTPEKAAKAGMIHETVATLAELLPRARAYIIENRGNASAAIQPWDTEGYRIPGGRAGAPGLVQTIVMAPPMLRQNTRGLLPAPEEILDCAVEAARMDFETALRIESRGLTKLVMTPEARNLMTTFFFQMNRINAGSSRPEGIEPGGVQKVGVLGAGMMGQGIAYVSAVAGIEVILKDISVEAAEKGKAYSAKLLARQVEKGRMDEAEKEAVLASIKPTATDGDLRGCDLIIEAVFEDIELKGRITASTEKYLAADGVWGSNTSSLPIGRLAEASSNPGNFIGIHFFSPVDRMPLVEIICGKKTSDETLAKAFDYSRQIGKTPIVVNDSMGFFTSRTFGTYLDEGARLVTEGVYPVRVDNLGKAAGMPVGPLTVQDEVSFVLLYQGQQSAEALDQGEPWGERDDFKAIIAKMWLENNRGGRHHGGGYYDYGENGKTLWPGIVEAFYREDYAIDDQDIKDRLLFRQVIETLKCLEGNVLRSVADGNIGSIMGIGAPTHTGGFIQFVNTYGLQRFIDRCDELAERYGERFKAPDIVGEKLEVGEQFV